MKPESVIPHLMVEDVRTTLNYYNGALGFKTVSTVAGKGDEFEKATVQRGDVVFRFQSEDSLKKQVPELRHDEPAGGLILTINATGIQDFYDRNYQSLDVVEQIKKTGSGRIRFTIRDINGYYLRFSEEVGTT
jgi:uncharacterized glyoxalase superfamily protein PhnB